jgi:hypothetical protein
MKHVRAVGLCAEGLGVFAAEFSDALGITLRQFVKEGCSEAALRALNNAYADKVLDQLDTEKDT